jgi:transposase, IS30 family
MKFAWAKFYFCTPYAPWQRGRNENTNGLIREYFPKESELDKVTAEEVQKVEELLNRRPRKRHGWYTPYEVFQSLTFDALHLGI